MRAHRRVRLNTEASARSDAAGDAAPHATFAGWDDGSIVDLGDITAARGMEAHLLLWLRLFGTLGTGDPNIKVVH